MPENTAPKIKAVHAPDKAEPHPVGALRLSVEGLPKGQLVDVVALYDELRAPVEYKGHKVSNDGTLEFAAVAAAHGRVRVSVFHGDAVLASQTIEIKEEK